MDKFALSKELSYMLRHNPGHYGLVLDAAGWVSLDEVLTALRNVEKWHSVSLEDIEAVVTNGTKKRHEISGGKIRAYYGHSVKGKIEMAEAVPPNCLYHGTPHRALLSIIDKGLLPQARQYVHLSQEITTARLVGARRDEKPVILSIAASEAYQDGIRFYKGNEDIWLSDAIPAKFITVIEV